MALKKEAGKAGGFEQDGNVATVEAPAAPKAAAPVPVDAKAVAGTAIAKAAASSAVVVHGKMETLLESFKDALPAVDFGVLPRLVGSNGQIMDGDKKSLGSAIGLELVSWNNSYVISPGDDADEAKEAVRYSLDGETISGTEQPVKEYLDYLRNTEGYEKASVKHYVQLIGILTSSEKASEHISNMVEVSLSPQSRKLFEGYRLQESVKVRLGKRTPEGAQQLVIRTEVKSQGANTFTLLKVSDK